jgi:hypothetical protein
MFSDRIESLMQIVFLLLDKGKQGLINNGQLIGNAFDIVLMLIKMKVFDWEHFFSEYWPSFENLWATLFLYHAHDVQYL